MGCWDQQCLHCLPTHPPYRIMTLSPVAPLHTGWLANIHLNQFTAVLRQTGNTCLWLGNIDIPKCYLRIRSDQSFGHCRANAIASTGDDRHLIRIVIGIGIRELPPADILCVFVCMCVFVFNCRLSYQVPANPVILKTQTYRVAICFSFGR